MQVLPSAVSTLIDQRIGLVLQTLVWITAINRETGAAESMGLSSADTNQMITVDGQERLYFGAGGLIEVEPIAVNAGLEVRTVELVLAPLAPEIEMLMRGFDSRQAPVEIHRLILHPRTRAIVGAPTRRWKGRIDTEEIVSASEEQPGRAKLTVTSQAAEGTRGLALKKSDESQRLRRLPGGGQDRFARHSDVSGAVPVKWGEE